MTEVDEDGAAAPDWGDPIVSAPLLRWAEEVPPATEAARDSGQAPRHVRSSGAPRRAPVPVPASTAPGATVTGTGTGTATGTAAALPAPLAARRRSRRLGGRRIRYPVGVLRRTRSAVELLVLASVLAAVLAGVLAAVVAGISLALHHVAHG